MGTQSVHGGFDTHSLPPVQVQSELTGSFLKSRRDGLSPRTLEFYCDYLNLAREVVGTSVTREQIKAFLDSRRCSMGGKHAYYRTLRVFYNWLYSPRSGIGLDPGDNPMRWIDPPKVGRRILPSLTKEQVETLIEEARTPRDRAIVSLFAESGLRLSELAGITHLSASLLPRGSIPGCRLEMTS